MKMQMFNLIIRKQVVLMIAVGVLALTTRTQAYANLVTNGGFEDTGSNIQMHTNVPSDPDTVGLWKFDETSGTTATDDSIYGNNGGLVNFGGTGGQDVDVVDQSQATSSDLSETEYIPGVSSNSIKVPSKTFLARVISTVVPG